MFRKMPKATITLLVRSARYADVYRDTVRIAEADRGGLKPGRIHKIRVGKKVAYSVLRGLGNARTGEILLDEATRERLGVTYGQSHDFELHQVGFWGSLGWGWNATDPTYAAATRLGVLSFWLGVVSFFLGMISLIPSIVAWIC